MPKKVDSPVVKMKRNLRAKMRRGRGSHGATTVKGMLQGLKQRGRASVRKKVGVTPNNGAALNKVRNKITGLKNRMTLRGKRRR